MSRDIVRLGTILNQLHSLIQEKQCYGQYAAAIKLVLSCILFGGSALRKFAIGMDQKGYGAAVDYSFSVDLSNFKTVKTFMSASFLAKMDAPTRIRFCSVIEQSKFESIKNLRKCLALLQL